MGKREKKRVVFYKRPQICYRKEVMPRRSVVPGFRICSFEKNHPAASVSLPMRHFCDLAIYFEIAHKGRPRAG